MDDRLLIYYNRELQYLRELGGEFAKQFPKIAGRLGLDAFECADPYVERLLEGFAFLAARVQLKIDAEFPRFTGHLLEMVYPHYLAPTPSMAVVQLQPSLRQGALTDGFTLAFCPVAGELGRALEQVEPDFFPAVPRVYEKVHAAVRAELQAATGVKRRVVQWALAVGRRIGVLEYAVLCHQRHDAIDVAAPERFVERIDHLHRFHLAHLA